MDEPSFWLEEYKNISGQFQKFLELYIKTFLIYLGANGLLLKFAFDNNSTPSLKSFLSLFGILISFLLFVTIVFGEIMTRKLRRKRKTTTEKIGVSTEDEFIAGHWASIVFFVFNTCVLGGWIFILFNNNR